MMQRRRFLQDTARLGVAPLVTGPLVAGPLAIAGFGASSALANPAGLNPGIPHHRPRVRRVIFCFMHGGPSQVDTFDHKPLLAKHNGEELPFDLPANSSAKPTLLQSPWKFSRRGESGLWVSDLLPHLADRIDDLCIIRSMHTRGQSHGQAVGMINTGSDNFVRPSLGAWVSHALSDGQSSLPDHIALMPDTSHGGPRNYGSAFLPARHQATVVGKNGQLGDGKIDYLDSATEATCDLVNQLNRNHLDAAGIDPTITGAIEAVELAARMRQSAPGVLDLTDESAATLTAYGIGQKATDSYGRGCLLARRLAAAGVRFITVSSGQVWDQHSKLQSGHQKNALATDRPIAALLDDLKAHGLWDDTLVVWGGEFGRTPVVQGSDGRDHNPQGFTMWLSGGAVAGGTAYGQTDDFGMHAAIDRVHMHDLHATILHLLGIDHTRLTYRYAGRDFRLTDVSGRVIEPLFG